MKHVYAFALGFAAVLLTGLAVAKVVAADAPSAQAEESSEAVAAEAATPEEVMPEETDPVKGSPLNPKWASVDFSHQEHALGWSPTAFGVPKGMEERVQFWQDVYTKFTSEQGVLHDSLYVSLVYETVEFTDISRRTDLTQRQKEITRRKRVEDRKKDILARLKALAKVKDPKKLEGEDARIWDLFAKVNEKDKFLEATKNGRLRFQLGQRDIFARGIYFSGRYLRQMEEIFRQEGLPMELTRLPFVESSFNLKARSKVGASGIWQFMKSSAKPYMRIDAGADERNDPLRATRAAAKKLRDNYMLLKSWPLAITAWNHGPAGVRRLTDQVGSTDIVDLIDVRRGRFKFASASFYASFLAALNVEHDADRHFGALEIMPELRGAEIQMTKAQSAAELTKWFKGDLEQAKQLNPHLTEAIWSGRQSLGRKHIFRVPLNEEAQARAEMQ